MDLDRLLQSIGKECFVKHYHLFADTSLSNAQVAARLPAEYTEGSKRSRTATARRVIRAGRGEEALRMCSS